MQARQLGVFKNSTNFTNKPAWPVFYTRWVRSERSDMYNRAILIGRLGKDPETRHSQDGAAIVNVSIATNESWKDKGGEKQERTEWHNLVFFGRVAEIAAEYLRKGSLVFVSGRLQTRKWQDKEGHDRYTTEIVVQDMKMLGSKSESQGSNNAGSSNDEYSQAPAQSRPQQQPRRAAAGGGGATAPSDDFDDDIPFIHPWGVI